MSRQQLKHAQRIVVKIGTASLIDADKKINYRRIDRLAYTLSSLIQDGKEVLLVSSGAMGVGAAELGLAQRPKAIPDQQAVAAVGQVALMNLYSRFFWHYNQRVAQILMTRDVIDFPESLNNLKNNLKALLDQSILPVINENDAVAIDELDHHIKFGDNDTLSAIVAEIIQADLLILLTDVDGFYTSNPNTDPQASKLDVVSQIDDQVLAMAGEAGTAFSTGGMRTKLLAADRLLKIGSQMVIMDSYDPNDIFALLEGENIGTVFSTSKGD
ncbi:glutamate 5-kinase [Aerococcus urinaehominis]|uniref:Glutamate 5-kinase n=1 Tax=Aerococcus urinaehominis TaxID=128944 RepID=A0A0X8FKT2_9LACT|nr:glutamate 5-kinase [Aerococcus urinaehominis]AMB99057.1 glutamate 5-kinase [Aerococcus urinaehominis]SDM59274.1 glutamate 5-kinase [Aerococcus urinaehominis]